jgi:hypothetical protein
VCLRCWVNRDGRVSWLGWCHQHHGRRPVVVSPWSGRGMREREREEGDDRRGRPVSEKERESVRARAGPVWPCRAERAWADRPRASERASGPRVWLGRARERREAARVA